MEETIEKVKSRLMQFKWYRDLFSKKRFYLTEQGWILEIQFHPGEKLLEVDKNYNVMAWCSCGNELVHSESFLQEIYVEETDMEVYKYQCSHCGKIQYKNPCIGPGLFSCNELGLIH